MFDVNRAIERWRQQMADSGPRKTEILDELESHLRDELEAQLRSGLDPEAAFTAAAQRVGKAHTLKHEFAMSITTLERLKAALFILAGIPNQTFATNMNATRIEPAWATYLKATTFVLPAVLLAALSAIFVVPKFQQICLDAGLPDATAGTFWNLTYTSIQVILTLSHEGVMIAGAIIVLLALVEWRFAQWPRYRRAVIASGAFVINSLVLLALFFMFLAAIVAAPALAHAK